MDKARNAPDSIPVSVIGSQFMAPYPFDIKVHTYSDGNLVITDINDKLLINVRPCNTTFHNQRVLLDINDTPIVVLRDKNMTGHARWNVFRGNSKSNRDLLFTTKTPHMIQLKTCLDVFLANKKSSKHDCDFKIKGSWSQRNCAIHMGDSSTIIAQMKPSENVKFAEGKFVVTIHPNVDYAFVVALIAIIDSMKTCERENKEAVQAIGEFLGDLIYITTAI